MGAYPDLSDSFSTHETDAYYDVLAVRCQGAQ